MTSAYQNPLKNLFSNLRATGRFSLYRGVEPHGTSQSTESLKSLEGLTEKRRNLSLQIRLLFQVQIIINRLKKQISRNGATSTFQGCVSCPVEQLELSCRTTSLNHYLTETSSLDSEL